MTTGPKEIVLTDPVQHSEQTSVNAFGDELPAGSELCGGSYVIEKYLNSGGFGITYLARDSLNRQVVIKECFPSAMCYRSNRTVRLRSRNSDDEFETILELFEKEARALSELSHPYVVGVHQIFKDNNTAYMAIDFIDGRDLLQVIEDDPGLLGPEEVHELLLRCLEAVEYIHSSDVLHRDISPDNILLDREGFPVFIDFGAARESASRVSRVLSKVLTVKDGYSPQEFYLQGSTQVHSSDLYALAATFYHLITGSAPPSSHNRMAAVAADQGDPFEPLTRETAPGYEPHFLDAINRNLQLFPQDRLPSAEAWRDVIDVERRRQILLELAEEDRDLEEKVYRLVAEYRRTVQLEEAAATGSALPAPLPDPKPKPKPQAERPKRRAISPMVLGEPENAEGGTAARRSRPDALDPGSRAASAAAALEAKRRPAAMAPATRVLTAEEMTAVAPQPDAAPAPCEAPATATPNAPEATGSGKKAKGLRRFFDETKDLIMGRPPRAGLE